jgi:hypothetical protein
LFSALLLAISFSNELTAQTTTSGGLTGVVTDPSHAVVPDADVEIRDTAKGTVQSAKTDREGVYRFFFLAPGRYTLAVTRGGFRKESRAVNVLLGPPVSVNVVLAMAQASGTVTVTEEAPLVQAENGDVSTTMNQTQISEVPNPGNDLTYIAQTAPGAVMNTDGGYYGGNFSILGMPGLSNRFTLNGMNDNDDAINISQSGALGLLLGQNQIQEATVVSVGYSGQFGGAAGANINYITKSGGNDFHGNAQYYWNGRVLNANNWVNKVLPVPQPRPFDIANQWAGSLGGPIRRSKLFFFFDSEGLRVLIPQQFLVVIPSLQFEAATLAHIDSIFGPASASHDLYEKIFNLYDATPGAGSAWEGNFIDLGCPPEFIVLLGSGVPCARHFSTERGLPSQDTLTSGRVDWNASGNDRVFLQIQNDRGYVPFYVDPISPLFDADEHFPWWQGQMVETHTFGSSAASQFLLAGSYRAPISGLVHGSQALAAFPATLNFLNAPDAFNNLGEDNGGGAFPVGQSVTQYQISEDVLKIRGNHKFGFGANFERTYWTDQGYTFGAAGTLAPQTLDAFYQGGVNPASKETDFTVLTQSFASQTVQRFAFYNLALYGQDEWHARPNLTLTLAFRAEHQSNPVCKSRCFARLAGPFESVSHDPGQPYDQAILIKQKQALAGMDNMLWSPRLSFAWQPLGVSHNAVVRGGVGVFYDPVLRYLARILASNPPLLNTYTVAGDNLTPTESTSLFKDADASNHAFVTGFPADETLVQFQASIPGFSPPAITVPNRRTHSPQYQRWSLELQQAFGANTSLNVGYTGHHGIHQLAFNGSANAFGFGSLPSGNCIAPLVTPCAPDPRFSGVTQITSAAVSNYNGMVVSFRHRFSHWTQGLFQANYTYGHAFDEVSNGGFNAFTGGSALSPQDPNNLRGAYGPADYDVRHSFNANYVWEVPVKAAWGRHGPDSVVKGWQISGTIFFRTGFPYTVFDFAKSGSLAPNNFSGPIYAVPVRPLSGSASCGEGAAYPLAPHPCQPPQVLFNPDETTTPNPNANFVQAGCETGFNAGTLPTASGPCGGSAVAFAQGRNQFRGPRYFNTDFAIMKNTKLPGWEKGVLGIGFQFFNLFNHPNFGFPDTGLPSLGLGTISYLEQPPTSILGNGLGGDAAPRMIQLKVQLQF